MKTHFLLVSLLGLTSTFAADNGAKAKDLGFKWRGDICANEQGIKGYNPHHVGPCGDLRGLSLQGREMSGLDLRGANLDGMNLRGLQLDGANLSGAKARGANFTKCKLNGANLTGADLSGAIFLRAELNGADFTSATLSGADLSLSQIEGTQFAKSDLGGAKINTQMRSSQLNGAVFSVGTTMPDSVGDLQKRGMVEASRVNDVTPERRPASRQ